MDEPTMLRRLAQARVARLATADGSGTPHVVPITFALDKDVIYFAVDAKPKHTTDLKRLRNIASNPRVSVLVDHYTDDWNALWWVRVDGTARVIKDSAHSLDLLASKYPQYRAARPPGPVVAISIVRMTGWAATDNPAG